MPIQKIQTQPSLTEEELVKKHDFYEAYYSKGLQIRFDKLKIVNLLRLMGFYRYDIPDSRQSELVRIVDNKIRLVGIKEIRDSFEDYLMQLPIIERTFYTSAKKDDEDEPAKKIIQITPNILIGKMYDNLQVLFSADIMERLRPLNNSIDILEDSKYTKWLFFNNTALRITANGIQTVPYEQLEGYVWENSIINRNYNENAFVGDFEVFVGDICGNDQQRKMSLMSILGYLMHNNYETNLKAAMFTDVNEQEAGIAAGGTGKGLLGKALGQVLNRSRDDHRLLTIAGKGFEFKDTRYAGGDLTTQLIHIEDIDKSFRFSDFYNDITDGCTFRKLHQNPMVHFSKLMISVNHTINFRGSSDKRRLIIFELHNYYSETYTPQDKFSKRFFESEWKEDDWMMFYNFMIRCSATYMQLGLIEPQMVNYTNRLIQEQIPEDLVVFLESEFKFAVAQRARTEFIKKNMWDRFILQYPDYCKYGRKKLTEWCRDYLILKQIRSAQIRKSGNSEDDVIVLYPATPEPYSKITYIVK